ncbi:MAG: hypothetical protein QG623_84 [Patescibacteria group bacterium]|nr:hypothetical protein [Patescibacteria group bacterium]
MLLVALQKSPRFPRLRSDTIDFGTVIWYNLYYMSDQIGNRYVDGVSSANISAYWRSSAYDDGKPTVDLLLPLSCYFIHNVFNVQDSGVRRVEAGLLRVAPNVRGNGVGGKLVRGLGALTQKYDFPEIFVGLASQYSFDIFVRTFGWDRMILQSCGFLDPKKTPKPTEKLGLSVEEARSKLVAFGQVEKDPEDRYLGFWTTIELSGLDMSNWELPSEFRQDSVDLNTFLPN